MNNKKEHYGLPTAITMIIGIVVGSGIFFKSDDILLNTGGNILLGTLVLCIGAFSIIFGSLTLTELSIRTKRSGGLVGYYEEFLSSSIASGFAWFQTFIYYPSLSAVVSWVAGLYTCSLLGITPTLETEIAIGFFWMVFIYTVNILSYRLGGYFQNFTTFIKLIPLLTIAIIGVFFTGSHPEIPNGIKVITRSDVGFKWLAALAPIAFSYDGWIIAISITNEVKNPKKNMPLALIIGPLAVLGVYVLYFLGITNLLGSEYIMSTGNNAVNKAGELLLGRHGSQILLIFIIVSILGVVNGLTLASLRMPQALASKNMIPNAVKIKQIHPKYQLSIPSCLIAFVITTIWLFLHYITQKINLLGGGDISEIAIVFSYVSYIILYVKVISMKRQQVIKSVFKGFICPILALIGSIIILVGGIVSSPFYGTIFIIFCLFFSLIGYFYYKKKEDSKKTI